MSKRDELRTDLHAALDLIPGESAGAIRQAVWEVFKKMKEPSVVMVNSAPSEGADELKLELNRLKSQLASARSRAASAEERVAVLEQELADARRSRPVLPFPPVSREKLKEQMVNRDHPLLRVLTAPNSIVADTNDWLLDSMRIKAGTPLNLIPTVGRFTVDGIPGSRIFSDFVGKLLSVGKVDWTRERKIFVLSCGFSEWKFLNCLAGGKPPCKDKIEFVD